MLNVLRTSTVLLKPKNDSALREYAEASAILWNIANYERRKAWYDHVKLPNYASQCKNLKTNEAFKRLGTYKAQALLQKLNEAWQSFYALIRFRKQGKLPPHIRKLSPPRYWKEDGVRTAKAFYIRNDGWRLEEKHIVLGRGVKVPFQSGKIWEGRRGRLEVQRDALSGKWYAHIPVEAETPPSRDAGKTASLDLGICNLAALYIEDEKPVIYSGRAVLSDWVYQTKKIAELQSRLPQKRRKSRLISLLYRKRQKRLRHAIYAMLRDVFRVLDEEDANTLIVGDLKGIRVEANHGRKGNQKLHNFWTYGFMEKRIRELGEETGIAVRMVSERDTSKTCCLCGKQHNGRKQRGLMVCRETHRSVNADVNGAVNILNVAVNRFPASLAQIKGTSGSGLLEEPLMRRWSYNEWC